MSDYAVPIVTVLIAAFSLATVAVVFGTNSQTSNVIKSSGDALSSIIQAAVAPVNVASNGLNLNSNSLATITNGGFGSTNF